MRHSTHDIQINGVGGDEADTLVTTATTAVLSNDDGVTNSEVRFNPGTRLTFAGAGGGDQVIALAGNVTIAGDPGATAADAASGPQLVVSAGATAFLAGSLDLSQLNVMPGGLARMLADGTSVLAVNFLNLAPATPQLPGGILDLADNSLIVQSDDQTNEGSCYGYYNEVGTVTGYLAAGYDGGCWDDLGSSGPAPAAIISSVAENDAGNLDGSETLGVAGVGAAGGPSAGSFDGQPVVDGDVVVKFTWAGDANLDGAVNAADQTLFDAGEADGLTGWSDGDFNYDGAVDSNDQALLGRGEAAVAHAPPASITAAAGADFPVSSLPTRTPAGAAIASWLINWGDQDHQTFGPSDTVTNPYENAAAAFPIELIPLDSNGNAIYRYPATQFNVTYVPPPAPTGLTAVSASGASSSTINLVWTNPVTTTATSISILMSTDGANFYPFDSVDTTTDAYQATGLDGGTTYWFEVAGALNGGTSAPSNAASATTSGIPSPEDLSATAAGPNEVDLSWDDPAGLAGGFTIQRSAGASGTFTNIATITTTPSATATDTYADATVLDGTDYTYQIVGSTSSLASNPSVTADATTPILTPTNLTGTSGDGTDVVLNWTDPSSTAATNQFEVDRRPAGDTNAADWVALDVTDAGVDTYTDSDLTGLTGYEYQIQAINSVSTSAYTGPITVTTPLAVPVAPAGLAAGTVTPTGVDLSWNAPSGSQNAGGDSIAGYDVSVSTDEGQTYSRYGGELAASATSVDVTGLLPTSVYLFELTAVNAAGQSYADGPVGAKTTALTPTGPVNLSAGAVSVGQVNLAWNDTDPVSNIEVWRKGPADTNYRMIADLAPGTTSYQDTNDATADVTDGDAMVGGAAFSYELRAVQSNTSGGVGYSPNTWAIFTSPVSVTMPTGNVPSITSVATQSGQTYTDVDQLNLSFSAASDVQSVEVEYKNDQFTDGSWTLVESYSGGAGNPFFGASSSPVTFQAEVNTSYHFRIRGVTAAGETAWSTPVQHTTATGPGDTGTVGNLAVQSDNGTTVTLAFDNSLTTGEPYIAASRGGTNDDDIQTVAGVTGNTATFTGLIPGSTYYFQAYYGTNRSNEVSVILAGAAAPDQIPGGLWGAPSPNTSSGAYPGGVDLAWQSTSRNTAGYTIQRSVDGVNFTTIGTVSGGTFSYHDPSAGPDSVYFYQVYATTGGGTVNGSGPCMSTSVNTPGASIIIGMSQQDPAFNPEIWLNDEDMNGDGVPDYLETGPITGETQLVPVTVNVPLGAENYGSATLTWPTGIKLYSDNQKRYQVGTVSPDGTEYSLVIAITSAFSAATFYAESVICTSEMGQYIFHITCDLVNALPTTAPTATTEPQSGISVTAPALVITDSGTVAGPTKNGGVLLPGTRSSYAAEFFGFKVLNASYQWKLGSTISEETDPWQVFQVAPTVISSYSMGAAGVTTPVTATDLKMKELSFYWISGGSTPQVTCDATINGHGYSASIQYTFIRPDSTLTPTQVPTPHKFRDEHGLNQYGLAENIPADWIEAQGRVTWPAGAGTNTGLDAYLQTTDLETSADNATQTSPHHPGEYLRSPTGSLRPVSFYHAAGLDDLFPLSIRGSKGGIFNSGTMGTWYDEPNISNPGHGLEVKYNQSFQTYLMFKPNQAGCWVALEEMDWTMAWDVQDVPVVDGHFHFDYTVITPGAITFKRSGNPDVLQGDGFPESPVKSTHVLKTPTWTQTIPSPYTWVPV